MHFLTLKQQAWPTGIDKPEPLNVAIEAEIEPGTEGGAEQFLIGLTHGLANLTGDGMKYSIVTTGNQTEWIGRYSGPNTPILAAPGHTKQPQYWYGRLFRRLRRPAGKAWRKVRGGVRSEE